MLTFLGFPMESLNSRPGDLFPGRPPHRCHRRLQRLPHYQLLGICPTLHKPCRVETAEDAADCLILDWETCAVTLKLTWNVGWVEHGLCKYRIVRLGFMEAWVGRSMGNVNSCVIVMICAIFVVAGTHTQWFCIYIFCINVLSNSHFDET